MACSCWREPGNHCLSYIVEDATGLVAATAVFGRELDLLVTASDRRRWRFPVPEFYREPLAEAQAPFSPGGHRSQSSNSRIGSSIDRSRGKEEGP
jgi:hypothetical protein